ncbi:hypothetical protein [Rhizobium sp. Leaf391]|nr:hypothetical protein [Rhizobium sp. Leaf391]
MDALFCIREKCHDRLLVVVDPAGGAGGKPADSAEQLPSFG